MSSKKLINQGEVLFNSNNLLTSVLKINDSINNEYSIDEIENLFTKYTLVSMGQSSVYNTLKITHENYAILKQNCFAFLGRT